LRLDALPERNRMQPRPGMPEAFREYLQQRWEAGLPARSYSFCGSTGTRLRRLLLQTGCAPLAVASPIGWGSNAIAGNSTTSG
jgi:hypothetical protein